MDNLSRHIARCTVSGVALIGFISCGGGRPPAHPVGGTGSRGTAIGSAATFAVGGTVSGLVGQGLTVELLSLNNLPHQTTVVEQTDIVADGPFAFRMPATQNYGVAIVHQPHSPTQRCVVRNGQWMIGTTNVTVGIACG